jgi:hypothetical protein
MPGKFIRISFFKVVRSRSKIMNANDCRFRTDDVECATA